MNFIELGVMMLLGLVVVFMVVRPLVRRILTPETPPAALTPPPGMMALPDNVTVGADGTTLVAATGANMIDVATIQGQVHAQSVHRVGELADRNPNETAAIVRQWLQEPA